MPDRKIEHIILISLDTLRADCINASPTAYEFLKKYSIVGRLRTPELDTVLKKSLYFSNCISAAPYTSASHAAYFSGCWPRNNGVYEYFNRRLSKPTIFQYARRSGYSTIFQTDFPIILGSYLGLTNGVQHYFIENERAAFETLLRYKKGKTLSFFHFGGIHYPYGFHNLKFGGKRYENIIAQLERRYKISSKTALDDILDESFRSHKDKQLLLRYKRIVEHLYSHKKFDQLFQLYIDGINFFMETRFQPFLKLVKKFVDKNNALLIIFADHGEGWDSETYGHHNSLSDEVLHVPLMFYGRGVNPKIHKDLVRTIDLAPTIVSLLAGSSRSIHMDGDELNVFNGGAPLNNKRYALAQTWLVGDKHKLSNYQERVVKHKRMYKPLNTHLASEMAYDGRLKLVRYYSKNKSLAKEEMYTRRGGLFVRANDVAKEREFKQILRLYNRQANRRKKITAIPIQLKHELQSMGYNV